MRLGLLTSILENMSFEEAVDFAADTGYECLEVACWPDVKAERRYAGVCHIDVVMLDEKRAEEIKAYCAKRGVYISALAYYPNTMDENLEKREKSISHLKQVILASKKLNVNMVTTFIGREQSKNVQDNLKEFVKVWKPIIAFAEEHQFKIAIENCPMLFGEEQWPGGQNLACAPTIWEKMFETINSDYFGLNFDPSHFVWQQMDYIKPIYRFADKIYHVHFKDIKLFRDKLDEVGILAYPLEYMSPKIPGLGDIKWGRFVSALTDIGYEGSACVEVEDKAFEKDERAVKQAVELSYKYMRNYVI